MSTLSFKAQEDFVTTLKQLAQESGINLSAYIKLLLTKAMKEELSKVNSVDHDYAVVMKKLAQTMKKKYQGKRLPSLEEQMSDL